MDFVEFPVLDDVEKMEILVLEQPEGQPRAIDAGQVSVHAIKNTYFSN